MLILWNDVSAGRSCRFWALEMGWAQPAGWRNSVSFAEKVIWYRPPPMLRLPVTFRNRRSLSTFIWIMLPTPNCSVSAMLSTLTSTQ